MDSLPKDIFRFLISTTSRFTGSYESTDIRIDHAWPTPSSPSHVQQGIKESPYSRNYFVLSLRLEEYKGRTVLIPDYSYWGDSACTTLSILFGKSFYNHGFLISHGDFYTPDLTLRPPTNYFSAAPYNHRPRKDLGIPLKLERFASVAPLFTEEQPNKKFISILFAAGKFYLHSLQIFDREPELAYLDLITCGEILSNYYEYGMDELLDEPTKRTFKTIREQIPNGNRLVCQLQGNMRQITRRYVRTLLNLLTGARADFFAGSECTTEYLQLKKESIEKRLKASYKLRSSYVHSGASFGKAMRPYGSDMNEVQLGEVQIEDKKLRAALKLAPTYFGMERIMRFSLLRFMHLHGVAIDPDLGDVA